MEVKFTGEYTVLTTKDPLLTIRVDLNGDATEAVLDLTGVQPKLHKRLTKRLKAQQEAYVYNSMEAMGFKRLDE